MSAPEPEEPTRSSAPPSEHPALSSESGTTATGPPCPAPMPGDAFADAGLPWLARGATIDDYEILRQLGSGAFARVYLAKQISLDRLVALKVSRNVGTEARALARLEHHHIVQVFAELVEPARDLRLLSMQFVPGITLARVIKELRQHPPETWSGATFLGILDALCTEPTTFDLGGFAVRAVLEDCDHTELTCWLGARLAEALAHAHSQGVIHRDIKPANILVNRYGRPFLADFNMALNTRLGEGTFGGTLAYMAPEHLEALLTGGAAAQNAVDARADLYSLAVVLFEFLVGRLPFSSRIDDADRAESLRQLILARQAGAPSPREIRKEVPEVIDRLVRRCLDPAPDKRFPSAEAFAHAVDGCRELLQAEKMPDEETRLVRWCQSWPFTTLIVFGILPNVVGSVVNISYNSLLIVDKNPQQKACFQWLILVYNLMTYPLLVALAIALLRRSCRAVRRLREDPNLAPDVAALTRGQVMALPVWIVIISYVGWFPGGVFFPVGLHAWAGPIAAFDFIHFVLSFLISGLIASTYAYFGVQFVVLRVLYPRLWSDPSSARQQARQELAGVPGRLRRQQMFAVLIPLLGAALLISAGPDQLSLIFRVLVTSLIVLGLAGFALATRICRRLGTMLTLLTGEPHDRSK